MKKFFKAVFFLGLAVVAGILALETEPVQKQLSKFGVTI